MRQGYSAGGFLLCPKGYYAVRRGPFDWYCEKGVRAWRWWEARPSPLYPQSQTPRPGAQLGQRSRKATRPRLSPAPSRPSSLTATMRPPTSTPTAGRYFEVSPRHPSWEWQWSNQRAAEVAYPNDALWSQGMLRMERHPANANLRRRPPSQIESLFFSEPVIDFGAPFQLVFIPPHTYNP